MKYIITVLTLFVLLVSCDQNKILSSSAQISEVSVSINSLNNPGDGYYYQAWFVWDTLNAKEEKIPLYYFAGTLAKQSTDTWILDSKDINIGYLQQALAMVISIEDTADNNAMGESPNSSTVILASELTGNQSELSIGDAYLLNYNFGFNESYYSVESPTDASNEKGTSGVWFVQRDTTISEVTDSTGAVVGHDTLLALLPGLALPALDGGWSYESLVVFGDDTLSMGKFTDPAKADEENPFSGSGTALKFPGEDFLKNGPDGLTFPADLSGKKVLVNIMPPSADGIHIPYTSTVFETTVPGNPAVQANSVIPLKDSGLQTGKVMLNTQIYEQD